MDREILTSLVIICFLSYLVISKTIHFGFLLFLSSPVTEHGGRRAIRKEEEDYVWDYFTVF